MRRVDKGIANTNADSHDIEYANCIFDNITKVFAGNRRGASLVSQACRWGVASQNPTQTDIDFADCILSNINKAKSNTAAESLHKVCKY